MLQFISWDDSFSVNIKEIDDQHKNLINYAKDLQKAYDGGVAGYVLESILKDLFEFAKYHFETEEEIMKKYKYPDYEEHKKEHDDLSKKVLNLQKEFHNGMKNETIYNTLDLLSEWIRQHFLETDHKYAHYLIEKGVK